MTPAATTVLTNPLGQRLFVGGDSSSCGGPRPSDRFLRASRGEKVHVGRQRSPLLPQEAPTAATFARPAAGRHYEAALALLPPDDIRERARTHPARPGDRPIQRWDAEPPRARGVSESQIAVGHWEAAGQFEWLLSSAATLLSGWKRTVNLKGLAGAP